MHPCKWRSGQGGRIERRCIEEENVDWAGASRSSGGIEELTDPYGDSGLLERFARSGGRGRLARFDLAARKLMEPRRVFSERIPSAHEHAAAIDHEGHSDLGRRHVHASPCEAGSYCSLSPRRASARVPAAGPVSP